MTLLVDLAYTGMNRSETTRNETTEILAERLFSIRFDSVLGGRVVVLRVVVAAINRYATQLQREHHDCGRLYFGYVGEGRNICGDPIIYIYRSRVI